MFAIVGDVEGRHPVLAGLVADLPAGVSHVFQVGDLRAGPPGADPYFPRWDRPLDRPIHAISGNHEYQPMLWDLEAAGRPAEVCPGLWHYPRGYVGVFAGRRVGFLGGAATYDRTYRRPDIDWWPEEGLVQADVTRLLANAAAAGGIDLLLTHTAPAGLVRAQCEWAPGYDERLVEAAWEGLGRPPLVCGHLHRSLRWETCRVLDQFELALL